MKLTIGLEAISNYKRLSYTTWYALSEFVDNSTQAYFDNKRALNAALRKEGNGKLTVAILYDRENEAITITDNSIGMDETELENALRIAPLPPRDGGRGKYGMGMKTAACWFGDKWSIKTKKLGVSKQFSVTVDVPTIAANNGNLQIIPSKSDSKHHGTVITISNLHRKIQGGRAIANIKEYLRSIYRLDIKEGLLELLFQGEPLTWEGFETRLLRDTDGSPYLRPLDFEINNKRVTGWVGVLESGGRPYGGFSLIQNKRVITGYPEGWRPHSLFGQLQGSNDLVNQRLCGELTVDGFQVNHTKDGVSWQDDEEEMIDKKLAELCDDYRRVARERRKGDKRGPSQLAIDNAVDQVTTELTSDEMVDAIQLTEIPSEAILKQASAQALQEAVKGRPRIDVQVGDLWVKFYVNAKASSQDPYYAIDWKPDGTIVIAINQNHDYMVQLGDGIADFIRQCVYDGIAEFKASQKRGKVEPNTIRFLKDNLLRVPFKIHDDSPVQE